MLKPVNGHLLIEPEKHESFIPDASGKYNEIGVIIDYDKFIDMEDMTAPKAGDRVFFDSWLAAKYPKPDGKANEFYWLVKWEHVRAVETIEDAK